MAVLAPEDGCVLVWQTRATTTATAKASNVGERTPDAVAANPIAPNTGRFSMQLACARVARR